METLPWKSCIKCPNNFFFTEKVSVTETSLTTVTEKHSVKETNFCHRKKLYVTEIFPSDKTFCHRKISFRKQVTVQVSVRENKFFHRKKFLLKKKNSATDKSFCQRKKLQSQKQVNRNLTYQDIVISSPKGKYVKIIN